MLNQRRVIVPKLLTRNVPIWSLNLQRWVSSEAEGPIRLIIKCKYFNHLRAVLFIRARLGQRLQSGAEENDVPIKFGKWKFRQNGDRLQRQFP